jgi:hypothetical protein
MISVAVEEESMPTLVVENVPVEIYERLQARAAGPPSFRA